MSYFPRVARGVHSYPPDESAPPAERYGLGVVGLHEGRTALLAAYRTRNVRPVVGCDLNPDTLAEVAADVPDVAMTTSYDELLAHEGVDIVGVYTPDHRHGEQIIAAFEAGKDVVCTKPIVNDLATARQVLAAARRTGRRLLVGQSTRFFESFRRQRAAFERGEVGDVEVVEAHYTHRMDWYYHRAPWIVAETDWVYLGMSHPLDLLRWYLGPIHTVSALGGRSALARRHGCASFDIYSVNAHTDDGRIGRAYGHYGMHELPRARNSIECVLYGSGGSSLAQYHDMQYIHTAPDGTEVVEDMLYEYRHYHFNNEVHGMHYGEFANYLQYFAEALASGADHSPDLTEGIETLCLMEAVRRSAHADGRPVPVAELLEEVGIG
ncbi:Gfo/Idh/MocA family oxidoreductase [Natronosporangium hydrolyticum]|uniref:Gfo/Idh/MocA family oxidoreductase n=1 Tax=Natronosporangium hydrolyticum TaxID=2811111 RepID=A0A895YN78_9ACTN|nr:Gfo/Idh/MocA family oxidoreductase [Natronosporangium hydrolyticum]QSB16763.1 Gfo/Idh/MocA family oxidoreductase [Natronosporangium hydrolyticum]